MFRFTIRELVLLTVIVAMGAGWWVDRQQLIAALVPYQIHEQFALWRQQDEKRLQELQWKLQSSKAMNEYGAPVPEQWKERSQLSPTEWEEIEHLRNKLGK